MDCFVANAPLRKRFPFVAGNDDGGTVIPAPMGENALISMDCRVKPGNDETGPMDQSCDITPLAFSSRFS